MAFSQLKNQRLVQAESLLATGILKQVFWLSRAGFVRGLELGVRVLHGGDRRVVIFPFASVPIISHSSLKVSVLSTKTNEGL